MTVAARQTKAQMLEVKLQKYLRSAGFKDLPLYISCDFRDDSLTVVGEHPRSLALKAKPTFAVIEAAIIEIEKSDIQQNIQQIGLCLKITDQKQPYAFHSFTIDNPILSRKRTVELPPKKAEEKPAETKPALAVNEADAAEEIALEKSEPETGRDEEYFPDFSEKNESDAEAVAFKVAAIPTNIADNPFDPLDMEPVETAGRASKISPFTALVVAGITSIAGIILASGYYVLSRPCVIGECTALTDAKQLNQNAIRTLRTSKVANSPEEAQAQLKQAIALLEPIPPWSGYRGEARKTLEDYQQQSQNLNSAIDATRFATLAAQKTQDPPVSEQRWQESETLWESALAQLGEIPETSPIYPFAQKKTKEYRANLTSANRRLTAEQRAEKILREAKSTAQIAEALEAVAQSAESWEKVQTNWEDALYRLSEIPNGTTSHARSQVLVPKYEAKISQARERKNVEGIAEQAYTQAVTLAAEARVLEGKNGWFQATENWRRALSYAEQVPAATVYSQKTKPLIGEYKNSLQQAEVRLREERNMQKARTDLDRTCKGNPKICDYTVSRDLIAVQMTPDYVQKLQNTFIQAQKNKSIKTRQAVENHVQTLQKALEAISENANIPLQVYDSEGKRIGSHEPS